MNEGQVGQTYFYCFKLIISLPLKKFRLVQYKCIFKLMFPIFLKYFLFNSNMSNEKGYRVVTFKIKNF